MILLTLEKRNAHAIAIPAVEPDGVVLEQTCQFIFTGAPTLPEQQPIAITHAGVIRKALPILQQLLVDNHR